MSHNGKKVQEEEAGEGAPIWIISFADMISLLMAFFVMLSTFADYGPKESKKIKGVLKIAMFESGSWFQSTTDQKGLAPNIDAAHTTSQGSTIPTLENTDSTDMLAETTPKNFRDYRIFETLSSEMFIKNGTTLSAKGRDFLKTFVKFWGTSPCGIIITERGTGGNDSIGLSRAAAVINCLNDLGIDSKWCSISRKGVMPESYYTENRTLEIWFADKNICL